MEKAVEMKIADFAKANRVSRQKLTAFVEEILGTQKTRVSHKEKHDALIKAITEAGKASVKALEASGVKNARYLLSRLEAKGLVVRLEEVTKTEVKGRPNYMYAVKTEEAV
jgi:hypothetical protein